MEFLFIKQNISLRKEKKNELFTGLKKFLFILQI